MAITVTRQAIGESDSDKRLARLYELLVTASGGEVRDPKTKDEWQEWVTPTAMNNFLKDDTLVDFLQLFGKANGLRPDEEYYDDPILDFSRHLLELGTAFEKNVIEWIAGKGPVEVIGVRGLAVRSLENAQRTALAMAKRAPVIAHPVLRDPDERTYGMPDLLIRCDVLKRLFPALTTHPPSRLEFEAPNLDGPGYVVIDVKFSRWPLNRPRAATLMLAYAVHNDVYNRALGRLQGATPAVSFLLGRGSVDECLLPIEHARFGSALLESSRRAAGWQRQLRHEGASWQVVPEPTVSLLRPNMKARDGIGWAHAKREIAEQLRDITLVPFCGLEQRRRAADAGITRWDDPHLSAEIMGLPPGQARTVETILWANKVGDTVPIRPTKIKVDEAWLKPAPLEVFVSVQTVDDPSTEFPGRKAPLRRRVAEISYLAPGGAEDWEGESLFAQEISGAAERELIESFGQAIRELARSRGVAEKDVRLIQWSLPIPPSIGYERLDMRWGLFQRIPIGVRGALGMGLREVIVAMARLGLPECDGIAARNGAEAAAVLWECAKQARADGIPLGEADDSWIVAQYGVLRCTHMEFILAYLRKVVFVAKPR